MKVPDPSVHETPTKLLSTKLLSTKLLSTKLLSTKLSLHETLRLSTKLFCPRNSSRNSLSTKLFVHETLHETLCPRNSSRNSLSTKLLSAKLCPRKSRNFPAACRRRSLGEIPVVPEKRRQTQRSGLRSDGRDTRTPPFQIISRTRRFQSMKPL
jgi:hypothetical protein